MAAALIAAGNLAILFTFDPEHAKEDRMAETITGDFETRREAELAVEHLVQQEGLDRASITLAPAGDRNTVGTKPDGADKSDGRAGQQPRDDAPTEGAVKITVSISSEKAGAIRQALSDAKARNISGA